MADAPDPWLDPNEKLMREVDRNHRHSPNIANAAERTRPSGLNVMNTLAIPPIDGAHARIPEATARIAP